MPALDFPASVPTQIAILAQPPSDFATWNQTRPYIQKAATQLLRGQISVLRGARNPHVQPRTFRFLRAVRLEL